MKSLTRNSALAATVLTLMLPMSAYALNATFVDGTLTIKGSKSNDWITVTGDGAGTVDVKAGKQADQSVGSYSGVDGIEIKAKGGNNQITLNEVMVAGSVKMTAGSGNDKVQVEGLLSVGGDLEIDLNGGNNTVGTTNQTSMEVGGHVLIDGNKGKDKITLKSISTGGDLVMDTGQGDNVIQIGTKNQYLVNIGGGLDVFSRRGENTVKVFGAQIQHPVHLSSGSGADSYTLLGNTVGAFMDVKSKGGEDKIVSRNNTVTGEYHIHCGSGSDNLVSKNDTAGLVLKQRCGS